MSTPQPISPPTRSKKPGFYQCYVDFKQQRLEAFWEGTAEFPVFSPTSTHAEVQMRVCKLSDAMSSVWARSKLLDYGTDACVKLVAGFEFPVIKFAHPNNEARQRVRQEYEIMRTLSNLDGVAHVGSKPLVDQDGVYGFCTEHLVKLDFGNVKARSGEVRRIVETLHMAGYCHGDISPSNVMENGKGEIVLIDFAFSGIIGDPTPHYIPDWVYCSDVFHEDVDHGERRLRYLDAHALECIASEAGNRLLKPVHNRSVLLIKRDPLRG